MTDRADTIAALERAIARREAFNATSEQRTGVACFDEELYVMYQELDALKEAA